MFLTMLRNGVSLARSVELSVQWNRILRAGPVYPVTLEDFHAARGSVIGDFLRVTSDLHRRLSDFMHRVVVHRGDEAIRSGGTGYERTPCPPEKWLRPDSVPPAPFLQCNPHYTPGGSGVLADLTRIEEEFRKAWLLYFLPFWAKGGQP